LYQPEAYAVALIFMFTSMLCWGSWAKPRSSRPVTRFNFSIGLRDRSHPRQFFMGHHRGSLNGGDTAFFANLHQTHMSNIGLALAGGVVFNVAKPAAGRSIDVAGMAVAFPVALV